jgi:hypothetical protein
MAAQERAKHHQQPPGPAMMMDQQTPAFAVPPPSYESAPPPPTFAALPPATFAAPPPPSFAAPPPSFDFLDAMMMGGTTSSAPPPSFDTAYLPQPQQQQELPPPPAFHSGGLLVPEAPSAPSFDLLMMDPAPMMAPPPPPMMPPSSSSSSGPQIDDEAIRMILAMEGMSDADKQQLIQEQLKIMQSIENTKKSSHVSAADAFEQRSFSAAVGATTNSSSRSNAPPDFATIDMGGSATDDELAQMEADRLLAQELQKEEYESADRHEAREEQHRAGMASSSSVSTTLNNNATAMAVPVVARPNRPRCSPVWPIVSIRLPITLSAYHKMIKAMSTAWMPRRCWPFLKWVGTIIPTTTTTITSN